MATHPESKAISQSLASALGQDLEFTTWQGVAGGDINQSWQATAGNGQSFFIKTNRGDKLAMFEAEAVGLGEISQGLTAENPLRIPAVYNCGTDGQYAWLVMEYLPLGSGTRQSERELGRGLAMLHQQTSSLFGFKADNFIGSSPQANEQHASWLDFLATQRFETQFKLAEKNGFFEHIRFEAEQLLKALPCLLGSHSPQPSLLHGDLWSGNKGVDNHGNPTIFDPACYYGDRECDLAMTELFGGFSAAFYEGYDEVFPIEQGYQQRKTLYNLYHILNHANLFGGHYIQQSKRMMQQLQAGI